MNSFFKKLISSVTILSLCTALFGLPAAYADEPDTYGTAEMKVNTRAPTQDWTVMSEGSAEDLGATPQPTETETPVKPERKIYVDFMGRGAQPEDVGTRTFEYLKQADENNEFWIGVAVDKVNDLSLFKDGVYSLELAFEYDPTFIKPFFDSNPIEWEKNVQDGSFGDSNSSVIWNKNQYEIIVEPNADLETGDRENKNLLTARENWKMCTVCVTFKDGVDFSNPRFKDITEDTKQYLIRLPFRLIHAPSESDSDQNPTVLSFVRGPEVLNIGSAATGVNPYSSWETTITDPNDQKNMKTLFTFDGDIKLFGPNVTGGITDIVAAEPEDEESGAKPDRKLSQDPDTLLQDGFDPEVSDYYLSVPNDVDKLKMKITSDSSDPPQVTVNGTAVTVNTEDSIYATDLFDLLEINKDTDNGGEINGFNNKVVISDGDKEYIVHIRRLYKPKIVLNYGNSPVGEIMRSNKTEEEKMTAINEFKATRVFSDITPNLIYFADAWNSYTETDDGGEIISSYDGDLDPTAMFIYQRTNFRDVGFIAYDSNGEQVNDSEVSLSLTMTSIKDGFVKYDDTDKPELKSTDENAKGNNYLFTEFTNYNIRPDVYNLTYTFTDQYTKEQVQQTRKVIAITKNGDVLINGMSVVNPQDANSIGGNVAYFENPNVNSLYKFRIADTVINDMRVVNPQDANRVSASNDKPINVFYNTLPSE